ncbi:MAG: hypothetical protein ACR5KV_06345 [Wolbachia sp.]
MKDSEVIEEHTAYGFDISILRLFTSNKLSIGASAAFWRQSELFVEDPYREKPKNGFMFTIDTRYEISKIPICYVMLDIRVKALYQGNTLIKHSLQT